MRHEDCFEGFLSGCERKQSELWRFAAPRQMRVRRRASCVRQNRCPRQQESTWLLAINNLNHKISELMPFWRVFAGGASQGA
ncbi:MAG: hypothetical protein KME26_15415 [Oscillatoria princeps RMCB-10]|nr:hypothetical protein [Oscillatoria princeps RMCB-10]